MDSEEEQLDDDDDTEDAPGLDPEQRPELDDFEEEARAAVDALQEAVAEPAAFLQTSTTISKLARHAAKVRRAFSGVLCSHCFPYILLYPDLCLMHGSQARTRVQAFGTIADCMTVAAVHCVLL